MECSFGCVAHSAVLLKPNVANILPVIIVIDCNVLYLLNFEEKWPNYASGSKFAPNSDSFWVRRLFNVYVWVFCAPNATILLVYIPTKIKMSFIWKDDFFDKIGIFCKSIAGQLCEAKPHWLVNWLQLLNQLNFVWRHTKVFMQNSSQCCLRNVQLLRTTVNWCWWSFTNTFCHSRKILGCTHCLWLFTLWFIVEDASFFHLFHKIISMWSWRCFSSFKIRTQFSHTFCNIKMIFKVISQYLPALFKHIHNHIRSAEG